jgi:hypothetical protein
MQSIKEQLRRIFKTHEFRLKFLYIISSILTLSYSSKINGKNMFSEGFSAHLVWCDSLLQIVMVFWCTFFKFEIDTAACNGCLVRFKIKKVCQTAITICSGLSRPTRSLRRIVCRGQEGSKGSKGTLRPDFQANTLDLGFVVITRNRKVVVKKSRYI